MNVAQRLTSIYPSPAEDVRRLGWNIHELIERTEYGVRHFIDEIERKKDGGWSPHAMVAINMANDVRILRELADQINTTLTNLTKEN